MHCLDWKVVLEEGNQVAKKFYLKYNNEAHERPVHLKKLYAEGVLQMTSSTGESPIHDLNLTVEHTNADRQEELLNIKGLLGMMKIITQLKANLALPPLNQYSEQTTLQFVHS